MAQKGINKVILIGRLGNDPEIRHAQNGNAIVSFTMATTESWKDKQTGQQNEVTEWHRCSAFGRLAEIIGEYVKKGSNIYVEGKLKTRKWQDNSGQDRYTTEIVVNEMQMLDSRTDRGGNWGQPQQPNGGVPYQKPNFDDEIPF